MKLLTMMPQFNSVLKFTVTFLFVSVVGSCTSLGPVCQRFWSASSADAGFHLVEVRTQGTTTVTDSITTYVNPRLPAQGILIKTATLTARTWQPLPRTSCCKQWRL